MLRRPYLIAIIATVLVILVIGMIVLLVLLLSPAAAVNDDGCHILSPTAAVDDDDDVCRLPPVFWCDHPDIRRKCATDSYCNISSNNPRRRFELTVVFASLCPDSQAFIIDRLYPTILNQASMRERIDIRLLPWGWAKRNASGITCQHGPGECRGNLLISCLMAQETMPIDYRYRLFNCIESRLRERRLEWIVVNVNETVVDSQRDECFRLMAVNENTQASIRQCIDSDQGAQLQADAEQGTNNLGPSAHGDVPWIVINNRSIIEMQAYQMMLAAKLSLWLDADETPQSSSCQLPSDFWCDNEDISAECFDKQLCSRYSNAIYGQPTRLIIVYNVDDRQLISNELMKQLANHSSLWYEHSMQRMYRIRWLPRCADETSECNGSRIHECVQQIVDTDHISVTDYVICHAQLLSIDTRPNDHNRVFANCANQMSFPIELKNRILACAHGNEGSQLHTASIGRMNSMKPEPPPSSASLWLVINDMSSQRAQIYQSTVYQLICMWYRGPGHDRQLCARCLYEQTWCTLYIDPPPTNTTAG